jgi:hypothetical protein
MAYDNAFRMGEAPPKEEISEKLKSSLAILYQQDLYLLKEDSAETSIAHRLALYLQQKFDAWHVDCEYNRDYSGNIKRINGRIVRPDIIIHRRDTRSDNLVSILIKKMARNRSEKEKDLEKLRGYKEKLGYRYAIFLEIGTGSEDCGKCSFKYV